MWLMRGAMAGLLASRSLAFGSTRLPLTSRVQKLRRLGPLAALSGGATERPPTLKKEAQVRSTRPLSSAATLTRER